MWEDFGGCLTVKN